MIQEISITKDGYGLCQAATLMSGTSVSSLKMQLNAEKALANIKHKLVVSFTITVQKPRMNRKKKKAHPLKILIVRRPLK